MSVREMALRSIEVGTHCILHFTSFSMGMGFKNVKHDLPHSNRVTAYLVELVGFEAVLENLEVGNEFILVLSVHLDSRHRYVA